jgi:hypothetical protein
VRRRSVRNHEVLPHCDDHYCRVPGCHGRRTLGPYCDRHTCDVDGCFSQADDTPTIASPRRVCARHRHCSARNCTRFCTEWESGFVAPYCPVHCCQIERCEKERRFTDSVYCSDHHCAKTDCPRPCFTGGSYCEEHICKNRRCQEERTRSGSFCSAHECAERGCHNEADPIGLCSRHGTRARTQYHMRGALGSEASSESSCGCKFTLSRLAHEKHTDNDHYRQLGNMSKYSLPRTWRFQTPGYKTLGHERFSCFHGHHSQVLFPRMQPYGCEVRSSQSISVLLDT